MVNKRNTLGRGLGSLLNVSENKDENKFFDEIDINDITINKDQIGRAHVELQSQD